MRKQELVKSVAEETGLSEAQANNVVTAVFSTIEHELARQGGLPAESDERKKGVGISGFGTFKAVHRPAREGRNPQSNEPMTIAARTSATFTPGTQLKRSVNGGDE